MTKMTCLGLLVLTFGMAGCSSQSPNIETWLDHPHEAVVLSQPAEANCPGAQRPQVGAAWNLALPGEVQPSRAPLPATEAEHHLFRNLYETLIRVDCQGQVTGGLAESWQAYEGGRIWVFHLRDKAKFWDGESVTASRVIASWRRAAAVCRMRAEPSPFLLFDPNGQALEALSSHELVIRLRQPSDRLPLHLAHPALAIVGSPGNQGWLEGSGPCRPAAAMHQQQLVLEPHEGHPLAPIWEQLTVQFGELDDTRGLLDDGFQALVTRDRRTLDYYAERHGTRLEALPWDRRYYLVVPEQEDTDRIRWTAGWNTLELAREVATQDAQPATFFAHEPLNAPAPELPPHVPVLFNPGLTDVAALASRDRDLLLWPADDPEAGHLAERLALIASRPIRPGTEILGRGPLTPPNLPGPGFAPEAALVPGTDLPAHIQAGKAGAMVLPWPRRFPESSAELARLLSLAQWLQDMSQDRTTDTGTIPPSATAASPLDKVPPPLALAQARRLELTDTVQPLIQSRAQLIRVPDLVGLTSSYDGSLRLWTGGWRRR